VTQSDAKKIRNVLARSDRMIHSQVGGVHSLENVPEGSVA